MLAFAFVLYSGDEPKLKQIHYFEFCMKYYRIRRAYHCFSSDRYMLGKGIDLKHGERCKIKDTIWENKTFQRYGVKQ